MSCPRACASPQFSLKLHAVAPVNYARIAQPKTFVRPVAGVPGGPPPTPEDHFRGAVLQAGAVLHQMLREKHERC